MMMHLRPLLIVAALALPMLAAAQTPAPEHEQPEQDPPARVARLSFLSGDVTFQSGSGDAIEDATLNRPVTTGDRVINGRGARSELTFGVAAIRLDTETDLSVSNLDDEIAQFEIYSGIIAVHVRELENGQTVQIDAPNATVQLLEPGDYRVEVDDRGNLYVDVRSGEAEVDAGNQPVRIQDGEQVYLAGGSSYLATRRAGTRSSFERWAMDRERQMNGRETTRYVSREVVGYEDLDGYGDWRDESGYGSVWVPRVAADWAPYRYGRWVWVAPWGWTWVDRASWGFAPFHYGRWAYVRSNWCWVPGPRHYRPVYAPALVGWMGDPYGGLSISVSTGPIGWFPLGPREVYVPHRHVSPRYLRNVNVSNTIIINNTHITNVARNRVNNIRYVNRDAPGAVSRAPRHDFDSRRPSPERQWNVRRGNDDRGRPGFNRDGRDNTGNRAVTATRDRNNGNTVRLNSGNGTSDRRGSQNADRNDNRDRGNSFQGRERPEVTQPRSRTENTAPRSPRTESRSNDRSRDDDRRNSSRSTGNRAIQGPVATPTPPPELERDLDRSRETPRQNRGSDSRRETRPDSGRSEPSQRNNHMYRGPDRQGTVVRQAPPQTERRETPVRSREREREPNRPQPEQRSERQYPRAIQGAPRESQEERGSPRSQDRRQRSN